MLEFYKSEIHDGPIYLRRGEYYSVRIHFGGLHWYGRPNVSYFDTDNIDSVLSVRAALECLPGNWAIEVFKRRVGEGYANVDISHVASFAKSIDTRKRIDKSVAKRVVRGMSEKNREFLFGTSREIVEYIRECERVAKV